MPAKKKYKYYQSFIGETIVIEIGPYDYSSPWDALRDRLSDLIDKHLDYRNGLICHFKDIETIILKNKIIVKGLVTDCEVDCG